MHATRFSRQGPAETLLRMRPECWSRSAEPQSFTNSQDEVGIFVTIRWAAKVHNPQDDGSRIPLIQPQAIVLRPRPCPAASHADQAAPSEPVATPSLSLPARGSQGGRERCDPSLRHSTAVFACRLRMRPPHRVRDTRSPAINEAPPSFRPNSRRRPMA